MREAPKNWIEFGARVAEARRSARFSQAELAAAVKLDRTAITKIEAGERKLDTLEFARLAKVLKRPMRWFLDAPLPAVVSRRKRREAIDESQSDVLLESLAWDVSLLVELKVLEVRPAPVPAVMEDVASAERAAQDLRKALHLTSAPVWALSSVAECVGLFVFSLDLGDEALDGAYLRLAAGGVAVVNGASITPRRRFTLVHELGHHIFADDCSPEWIVGADGDDRERLLNAFAIHFLMPREGVASRWKELDGLAHPREAAIALGAEFGVSWTAVVSHLCNLELINDKLRAQLDADRPGKGDYVEGGLTLQEELIPPDVPPRFAQAVVRAYKRHKIGPNRAVELLHGKLARDELPPEDHVPIDSMKSQFDLD